MGKGRKLAEAQGQEMFGEVICVKREECVWWGEKMERCKKGWKVA